MVVKIIVPAGTIGLYRDLRVYIGDCTGIMQKKMETTIMDLYRDFMGGCQDYGSFLVPFDNTAPNVCGTQKGTTFLTTTHLKNRHPNFHKS